MSDGVALLHADKHESFLQIDTTTFDGDGQAFPKFRNRQVCDVFDSEVDFLHAGKH